jgi:hypothetical protein
VTKPGATAPYSRADGRREKDDLLLLEYAGVMRDVKLASDTQAYLADDVLLLGPPGMDKNDAGVRRVAFDTVSFADSVQHLAKISSRSLIVITGRQTVPASGRRARHSCSSKR